MNTILQSLIKYIFWFSWSIIVGGLLISGPLLAPLAFKVMPVTVSPEIAQYAHSYASTLFTLFFVSYFPLVAGAFLLISLLEQFYLRNYWKEHNILAFLCEIILLAGNAVWLWLALKLVPEMESMVLNVETWNSIAVREAFTSLHIQSQALAEIGLILTLVLPWLSKISGIVLAKKRF
jgi:divalent metal cation (Fe/Co/Zn/Cd) transporter